MLLNGRVGRKICGGRAIYPGYTEYRPCRIADFTVKSWGKYGLSCMKYLYARCRHRGLFSFRWRNGRKAIFGLFFYFYIQRLTRGVIYRGERGR